MPSSTQPISTNERVWSSDAIDRFVIGRMYKPYTLDESAVYLRLKYRDFANVTPAELEDFEQNYLASTNIFEHWRAKGERNAWGERDARVDLVLGDIDSWMLGHKREEAERKSIREANERRTRPWGDNWV